MGAELDFGSRRRHELGAKRSQAPLPGNEVLVAPVVQAQGPVQDDDPQLARVVG
jgi:hypothetical protein